MVCGCASIWMMEGMDRDRPTTDAINHNTQYTVHTTRTHLPARGTAPVNCAAMPKEV